MHSDLPHCSHASPYIRRHCRICFELLTKIRLVSMHSHSQYGAYFHTEEHFVANNKLLGWISSEQTRAGIIIINNIHCGWIWTLHIHTYDIARECSTERKKSHTRINLETCRISSLTSFSTPKHSLALDAFKTQNSYICSKNTHHSVGPKTSPRPACFHSSALESTLEWPKIWFLCDVYSSSCCPARSSFVCLCELSRRKSFPLDYFCQTFVVSPFFLLVFVRFLISNRVDVDTCLVSVEGHSHNRTRTDWIQILAISQMEIVSHIFTLLLG